MQTTDSLPDGSNALAGPSSSSYMPRKPRQPFISADHRRRDGSYRVLIISSGSVASIKIPEIVGALSKNPRISVQVVATKASLHFYDQQSVDRAVYHALGGTSDAAGGMQAGSGDDAGVRVWTDEDEWSDWKKVGDPILHIELRRWADLVLVAPCSADMLAKIAGGLCDNLALSVLRALSSDTPTILFPAMNTHMYSHPLTANHLRIVQEKLGYMVSGPQGAGRLACGDDGPGKMTDWRDIVSTVEDRAATHLYEYQKARLLEETLSGPRRPLVSGGSKPEPGVRPDLGTSNDQTRPVDGPKLLFGQDPCRQLLLSRQEPELDVNGVKEQFKSMSLPEDQQQASPANNVKPTGTRTRLDRKPLGSAARYPCYSFTEDTEHKAIDQHPQSNDRILAPTSTQTETRTTSQAPLSHALGDAGGDGRGPPDPHIVDAFKAKARNSALAWNNYQPGLSTQGSEVNFGEPTRLKTPLMHDLKWRAPMVPKGE